MKQVSFTGQYKSWNPGDVAVFDTAEATQIQTDGLGTITGDSVRLVPDRIREIDAWEAAYTVIQAHQPWTFTSSSPTRSGQRWLYQLEPQGGDFTTGVSFDAAEEARYVPVCRLENLGTDHIQMNGGNVAVSKSMLHLPPEIYAQAESVTIENLGPTDLILTNDHAGGAINLDGALSGNVTLSAGGMIAIQFSGDDIKGRSGGAGSGAAPTITGTIVGEGVTLAAAPAAATNTDNYYLLTAQDGGNVSGLYKSNGATWVISQAISSGANLVGDGATLAAAPIAAANSGKYYLLTAQDGVNAPGYYKSNGAAWISILATGGSANVQDFGNTFANITAANTAAGFPGTPVPLNTKYTAELVDGTKLRSYPGATAFTAESAASGGYEFIAAKPTGGDADGKYIVSDGAQLETMRFEKIGAAINYLGQDKPPVRTANYTFGDADSTAIAAELGVGQFYNYTVIGTASDDGAYQLNRFGNIAGPYLVSPAAPPTDLSITNQTPATFDVDSSTGGSATAPAVVADSAVGTVDGTGGLMSSTQALDLVRVVDAVRPLGTDAATLTAPGQYSLTGTIPSLTVNADNVNIIGNGKTITKLLNTGIGNKFSDFICGNPAATNPTVAPPSSTINVLNEYIAWSETPARFDDVTFIGNSPTGNQVGLLMGINGNIYRAESVADVDQASRSITSCRFINCGTGLFISPFMEYVIVSSCEAHYNGTGFGSFAGNTVFESCTALWNREGWRYGFPKVGGIINYAWSGELTPPTTYTNALTANAFHTRMNSCLVNHNGYGLSCWESTGVSDPEIYAIRASDCEFQGNSVADVMAVGNERVRVVDSYLRGIARGQSGGIVWLDNSTPGAGYTEIAGGLVYENTFPARSTDPNDPPPGHHVRWQSDGTGAGDDGDWMMKITDSGGTTKTITDIDFSAA